MQTATSVAQLHAHMDRFRRAGQSIALVPTMGGLHAGHMQLITRAKQACDQVVVSIFVNPLQFGVNEDLDNYPGSLDADKIALEQAGAALLFAPDVSSMYPQAMQRCTKIVVPGLSDVLCGRSRPGHFSGVATVVAKLLNSVQPDCAFFGEKDYQQLLVIRKMVADLHMPVTIHGVPTVREDDGLAMSSRNSYLTQAERRLAPALYRALQDMVERIEAEGSVAVDLSTLAQQTMQQLNDLGFSCDYIEVRRACDLALPAKNDRELRILAAACLGQARLIDNLPVIRQN